MGENKILNNNDPKNPQISSQNPSSNILCLGGTGAYFAKTYHWLDIHASLWKNLRRATICCAGKSSGPARGAF
jgi:hypothetical protein